MRVLDLFTWQTTPASPEDSSRPVIYRLSNQETFSIITASLFRVYIHSATTYLSSSPITWAYLDETYSPDPLAGCILSSPDEIIAEGLPPHAMIFYPNQPPFYVKLES